jgi:hypothetical protein
MLRSVVEEVAPLAQRLDVPVPPDIAGRIVVEVRGRQHDLGRPKPLALGQGWGRNPAALAVAPEPALLVPPTPVA